MDILANLVLCEDGSCCCLTLRSMIAVVAILNSMHWYPSIILRTLANLTCKLVYPLIEERSLDTGLGFIIVIKHFSVLLCLLLFVLYGFVVKNLKVVCLIDMLSSNSEPCYDLREYIESIRNFIVTLFQMANMMLLLASIIENSFLIQLYIWYTLGFVVTGFVVSIVDFSYRFVKEDVMWSFVSFVPDVAFLSVVFRCLPLIDAYRKQLQEDLNIVTVPK